MKWSLNLGKIAGIRLLLHWTFLILIFWIAFAQIFRGGTLFDALYAVGLILVVFATVVLHELGHALTAKRYNIQTRKILLLPIGGIADLEKLPEDPKQEVIIAIAGPMVNVVIAIILFFTSPINQVFINETDLTTLSRYQLFWTTIFSVNVLLVLFNLIPAFPLDGGRVLRALLAFKMSRVKATQIASNIGQFIAIIFVFAGLFINPFLSLIGVFVFFAAYSENYFIRNQEVLRQFTVKDAMMTQFTILTPEMSLQEVSDKVIQGTEQDFIISGNGQIEGVLTYPLLIQGLKQFEWNTPVKNIMAREFESIDIETNLDTIFLKLQKERIPFLPVMSGHQLAGVINLNNINEFLAIRSAAH